MPLYVLIFFGLTTFIAGGDIVAIEGRNVIQLDLFGAGFIPYVMWVYLLLYIAGIVGLKTGKKPFLYGTTFAAAVIVLTFPSLVLHLGSQKIKLSDHPSPKSMELFKAAYPVRYVSYSASSEGDCLLVRKQDYSLEMESFIRELVQKQSRTNASSQPLTAPDFCGNFCTDYASRAVILRASRPTVSGG